MPRPSLPFVVPGSSRVTRRPKSTSGHFRRRISRIRIRTVIVDFCKVCCNVHNINFGRVAVKRFRSVLVLSVQIAGIATPVLPMAALADPTVIDTTQTSGQVKVATSSGERIYIRWCAECHGSAIGPGTQALERKYQGQVPAILHVRTGIPTELVTHTVRHGMGFMPPFRKTEISNSELASLATYLASVDRDSANRKVGPVK